MDPLWEEIGPVLKTLEVLAGKETSEKLWKAMKAMYRDGFSNGYEEGLRWAPTMENMRKLGEAHADKREQQIMKLLRLEP